MSLYIRKLEICDEYDTVIYKATNMPARDCLSRALTVVNAKDSKSTIKRIFNKFLLDLDSDIRIITRQNKKWIKKK